MSSSSSSASRSTNWTHARWIAGSVSPSHSSWASRSWRRCSGSWASSPWGKTRMRTGRLRNGPETSISASHSAWWRAMDMDLRALLGRRSAAPSVHHGEEVIDDLAVADDGIPGAAAQVLPGLRRAGILPQFITFLHDLLQPRPVVEPIVAGAALALE